MTSEKTVVLIFLLWENQLLRESVSNCTGIVDYIFVIDNSVAVQKLCNCFAHWWTETLSFYVMSMVYCFYLWFLIHWLLMTPVSIWYRHTEENVFYYVLGLMAKQQCVNKYQTPLHHGLFLASLWILCLGLDFLKHQERYQIRQKFFYLLHLFSFTTEIWHYI